MKLHLKKVPELTELNIFIYYAKEDEVLNSLINKINAFNYTLHAYDDDMQYQIPIEEVYYIESVDRKTFLYCKDKVLRTNYKLQQLLYEIEPYDFVQINRTCLLNINVLESIKVLFNSRLEATLSNGEKLTVSRKYISCIKACFLSKGGKGYEK